MYTDKLDKGDYDDYLDIGFTDMPAQLVWLSTEGDSLFSYLDTVDRASRSEFSGIKRGRGDYFFTYGQYNLNHTEPMEFDAVYGFLMKIANDGEILWRRLYKHSDDPYGTPVIRYIYEHENGDIATLGREINDSGFFMWMMRINEYGCLGDDDCSDPMVLPVDDLLNQVANDIILYPNPTNSQFSILNSSDQVIESLALHDLNGQLIYTIRDFSDGERMDLTAFETGIYILKLRLENHKIVVKKIVKH